MKKAAPAQAVLMMAARGINSGNFLKALKPKPNALGGVAIVCV
ncbi:hypothetical protein GCM10007928_52540 [Sulfitobacter porphyrae]|nr:hypothetical protein GCM10007928_52540 [Sulfitobacter porphyrae]